MKDDFEILTDIKRRHQADLDSGMIGGDRRQFDIGWLLHYIDRMYVPAPTIVTTYEELDALPDGSLIVSEQGGYWQAIKRQDGLNWWIEPGSKGVHATDDLTLPAEVLAKGEDD